MKHLLYIFVLISLILTNCYVEKRVEITYPEGGEVWAVETDQWIQWNFFAGISRIDVYYLMDETLIPIKINLYSCATWWEIPNTLGECRIVIKEHNNSLITDTSEYFTILRK